MRLIGHAFCNPFPSSVSRIAKELPTDPIGDHEISADWHGKKREVLVMSILVPRHGDTTCCCCSSWKECAEKEGVGAYRQEQRGGDEEDVPEM
jgi:hypothetical protein